MTELQNISPTCCQGCIFKVVDEYGYQCGCDIQDVSNEKYKINDDKSFQFEEKLCQFKRTEDWDFSQYSSPQEAVLKECELHFVMFSECNTAIEGLELYNFACSQTLKPKKVILVIDNVDEYKILNDSIRLLGASVPFIIYLHIDKATSFYNFVLSNIQYELIWRVDKKSLWLTSNKLLEFINNRVNLHKFRFFCIRDSSSSNYIISKKLYLMTQNISLVNLVKKLEEKVYDYFTISENAAKQK